MLIILCSARQQSRPSSGVEIPFMFPTSFGSGMLYIATTMMLGTRLCIPPGSQFLPCPVARCTSAAECPPIRSAFLSRLLIDCVVPSMHPSSYGVVVLFLARFLSSLYLLSYVPSSPVSPVLYTSLVIINVYFPSVLADSDGFDYLNFWTVQSAQMCAEGRPSKFEAPFGHGRGAAPGNFAPDHPLAHTPWIDRNGDDGRPAHHRGRAQ
ncbi:hypothetical protein VTO73DRAFT_955 [Trametes versicolor]